MKKFLKFLSSKGIYILIGICLLLGLVSLSFRNATLDDDLYLFETSIMTEALSQGEWIGDYAVGTHGFLFKLPVAFLFLLTGPSLVVATIWNVLLGCLALFLFYKILKVYFVKSIYPFLGTLLLLCNFQFLLNLPTYMREIPVLIGVLLLMYALIQKKSYWFIGLASLIVLDGKEYVFFMLVPALLIYILIVEWRGANIKTILNYLKASFQSFLPVLIFFLLMIFTPIIPLNMYALSVIPGVTKGGIEYQVDHFTLEKATTNRIKEEAPSLQRDTPKEESFIKKLFNVVVSYIGKILYPRSFSFLSIPKIIFFPALLTSILLFKNSLKRKVYVFTSFALLLWSYILVFVLRASFDRYLFPILPVIIFFFLLFIADLVKERKKFIWILVVTALLTFVGLLFEVDYIAIKIALNVLVLLAYISYLFYHDKIKNLSIPLLIFLSTITFFVIAFFFYNNGQYHHYDLWGKDYEVKKVVGLFKDDENIMINDPGWNMLINVYRGDNKYSPEWKWGLQDWVPRKNNLKSFEKHSTYLPTGIAIGNDVKIVNRYDVEKVALLVSTIEDYTFPFNHKLEKYMSADWLELEEIINLKNKELYIFKVLK